jgi:hypothetical protein
LADAAAFDDEQVNTLMAGFNKRINVTPEPTGRTHGAETSFQDGKPQTVASTVWRAPAACQK